MTVILWCLFWVGLFVIVFGGGLALHWLVERAENKGKPDYSGYDIQYEGRRYYVYYEPHREPSGDLWNFTATRTLTGAKRAIRNHWKAANYGK